ncbi:triple QxxK/R motif-containing protein isoform X4 [Gopherus flavomarginatus]|nr:triple QxxK/R motif-containing protein isoform X4 [Gopherus flavomarginatus]XP_050797411.1 triple QxxK/R motif-containing protein isoform X4 [Gopherus flavomarginatus]XP_050797412.1 triple QxxK/R motif-containing protein isoform X4 [Gopherus flavomarginatus]XP_050797416.1 triple QxxK/R motif-containing protein isoform X4 [Gopherus flavomarginatus]XP_050797418.1 triple QxxK/R motif-containing protein isoform X4 [Gopherus flavomarginatus]
MGRKDASAARIPVEQYRKQIGKQDYKKSRPVLRATRLKAEAKKTALGIKMEAVHSIQMKEFYLERRLSHIHMEAVHSIQMKVYYFEMRVALIHKKAVWKLKMMENYF